MKLFGRPQIIYQAQAISLESGEDFRKRQLSVLGEIKQANALTLRVAWTCMALMACWTVIILGVIIYVSPTLREHVKVLWIGRIDGRIQEIDGIENRPELFTEADNASAIRDYIELYYEYNWETNRKHEDRIRLKSGADQLARYHAWADGDPNSPKQKLAHHGSSEVDRVVVHKQPDGDAKTADYTVTFNYRETSNGRTDPIWHGYTGHIQFQRHPELVKDATWASVNPEGFYVTYFKADEDPK